MIFRSPIISNKKALSEMAHSLFSQFYGAFSNRTKRDYSAMLTDPTSSSLIMAVILWIVRRWPEAPLYLENGKGDAIYDHPMLKLLNRPNPYYSGSILWFGAIMSLAWDGNGYMVKIRDQRTLAVKQLWYVPHFMIEPMVNSGSSAFVDYYQYAPGNAAIIKIAPADIIHLRYGIDPYNPRKGMSPLRSIARDAVTDEEADNFSASMLHNMGVPGLLFSPDFAAGVPVGNIDVEAAKKYINDHFTGDNAGKPMIQSGPTKIQQFGFDPRAMDLSTLRGIPEERVSAVTGIPAAVVGFGSGLAQTKVGATMKELREMAYEDGIIPLQRLIGPELETQLLDDFEPNPDEWTVKFDLSVVRVLQDDQDALYKRTIEAFNGGVINRGDAKQAIGYDALPADNIRRIPFSVTEVEDGQPLPVDVPFDIPVSTTAAPVIDPATIAATEIQSTALNGAQVASLVDLAAQVSRGLIPLATARAIASTAFPMATESDLDAIFNPLVGFRPETNAPESFPAKSRNAEKKAIRAREQAFAKTQAQYEIRHRAAYAGELENGFISIAERVVVAYESDGLASRAPGGRKSDGDIDPSSPEGIKLTAETNKIITRAAQAGAFSDELAWKAHYIAVTETTVRNIKAIYGIALDLPDLVQREILAKGGKHIALVGVDRQIQDAVFQSLVEGRTAGLGPREIARAIRSNVEGSAMYPGVAKEAHDRAIVRGWSEEKARAAGDKAARQYRAEVISRTETGYAQNMSTLEVARGSGTFNAMFTFDNQRGYDDAECIERDGKTVSFDEAEAMANAEHPNGSFSASPTIV